MVKSEKLCQDYLLVKIKSICWERQCGMFKMYIWSFSENLAKMGANLLWRMKDMKALYFHLPISSIFASGIPRFANSVAMTMQKL